VNEIITRLKREKADAESGTYQEGMEEGLRWARKAPYAALLVAANLDDRLLDEVVPDEMEDYDIRNYSWIEGWCRGVREFWNDVMRKLPS
jgi:hypothetical protein